MGLIGWEIERLWGNGPTVALPLPVTQPHLPNNTCQTCCTERQPPASCLVPLRSIWNSTFLGRSSVAVLPYCQALSKFPSHIQQVGRVPGGEAKQGRWQPLHPLPCSTCPVVLCRIAAV